MRKENSGREKIKKFPRQMAGVGSKTLQKREPPGINEVRCHRILRSPKIGSIQKSTRKQTNGLPTGGYIIPGRMRRCDLLQYIRSLHGLPGYQIVGVDKLDMKLSSLGRKKTCG